MARKNDVFQGSVKTGRGTHEEFNELRAVSFSDGFKSDYRIVKEKIKGKWFFLIQKEDSTIFKIEIKK